jgi:hypothetical protein
MEVLKGKHFSRIQNENELSKFGILKEQTGMKTDPLSPSAMVFSSK